MNVLEKEKESQAVEAIEQLVSWYDVDCMVMKNLYPNFDAKTVLKESDVEVLSHWYAATVQSDVKKAPPSFTISYQAKNVPSSEFPVAGSVERFSQRDSYRPPGEDIGYTANSFSLDLQKKFSKDKPNKTRIWLRVNLDNPRMIHTQQEILDHFGIKIGYSADEESIVKAKSKTYYF